MRKLTALILVTLSTTWMADAQPGRQPNAACRRKIVQAHRQRQMLRHQYQQASGYTNPGEAQGFNPQPDPPAQPGATQSQPLNPGEAQGFNPQPDPPARPRFQPRLQSNP